MHSLGAQGLPAEPRGSRHDLGRELGEGPAHAVVRGAVQSHALGREDVEEPGNVALAEGAEVRQRSVRVRVALDEMQARAVVRYHS